MTDAKSGRPARLPVRLPDRAGRSNVQRGDRPPAEPFRWRRRHDPWHRALAALARFGAIAPRTEGPVTRGLILTGLVIVLVFFGAILGWAGTAPISSAAIAAGVVAFPGARKTVQHLEGGIVREILVQDGDRVAAGQVLVRLDDTKTQATLTALDAQEVAAAALEARLMAEQQGRPTIEFPPRLRARAAESLVALTLAGQLDLMKTRAAAVRGEAEILGQRIAHYQEQIRGLEGEIGARRRELAVLRQEFEGVRPLAERGVVARNRLYGLLRQEAQLEGELSQNHAAIAAARQSIGELESRRAELRAQRDGEIALSLREVQEKLHGLRSQITAARDALERTEIRAPVAGIAVDRRIHTPGGVLAAGSPIVDIAPSGEQLVIEARVEPRDRDAVAAGQPASVRFTAFSQRITTQVTAAVRSISADRLADPRTGEAYYRAIIELREDPHVALDGADIHPGMQAEVIIVTGERTALGYLARPILAGLQRALREQ